MAEISNPGISVADVQALITANSATSYVTTGSIPLATLIANYPASASLLGKYARVSNLYGSIDEILRCRFDGTNYNWVPQRESCTGTLASASGTVNFLPLVTPTTIIFTASALTANMTIVPSSVNAYNGQPAEFVAPSTLGLGIYTMSITGLLGSNVSLLSGQTRRLRYGAGGWYLLP